MNYAMNRRSFVKKAATVGAGGLLLPQPLFAARRKRRPVSPPPPPPPAPSIAGLPKGNAPVALSTPHFPDRLHAYVWRNWPLVPLATLARVVGAARGDMVRIAQSMGLGKPPTITADQLRRSYITIIRRNWHLLPYEQLLVLLGWNAEQLAFTLRDDDFLYVKLGNHKPACDRLKFARPNEAAQRRARAVARVVQEVFPEGLGRSPDPLFGFVEALSKGGGFIHSVPAAHPDRALRFCYSYFALYGDPLLEPETDPYPDGYLARLAESGVNGVWLQGLLRKLAPFPWDPARSSRHEERLKNLRLLVARAQRHGIGVYLYLNEPRALPLPFYAARPELKGVAEGEYAALCTSDPAVPPYLADSVASIVRAVPDLAGFFTITGSENLTHCWSHGTGARCPRCAQRSPAEVIAEVNTALFRGLQQAESKARLIAWDWGWADAWAEGIISRLPSQVTVMSVSEWSLPIRRGGVDSTVGEYSISSIGPGPRARRHWDLARKRGLKTLAKIQAGNTWELSAVPYIPALENVALHAARLRAENIDGLMLGWTLGGYPSPNLEVVAAIQSQESGPRIGFGVGNDAPAAATQAMQRVAERRFGKALAPAVVQAWRDFSKAFREFPFHAGLVYSAPLQAGPANLLWPEPTGYAASMVGFPYDDLDAWRAVYPPEIFVQQLTKVAEGFDRALLDLQASKAFRSRKEAHALEAELNVAQACAIHFRSAAHQARFVLARRGLHNAKTPDDAAKHGATLERTLREELQLARRLFFIQSRDSRIGFEASNQYYYVPIDLVEKVLSCRDLLDRWLPAQQAKWPPKRS